MPFTPFGIANKFRLEGHKIGFHLRVIHLPLPQGKHRGKVPVSRVIRAVVVVAPEQMGNGRVGEVRDQLP
jgi:hypothetical protein